jgi:hypothetical protein
MPNEKGLERKRKATNFIDEEEDIRPADGPYKRVLRRTYQQLPQQSSQKSSSRSCLDYFDYITQRGGDDFQDGRRHHDRATTVVM